MERAVALKKLGKILGKSVGYRLDPKAPDQDDRDAAKALLPDAAAKVKALREQMEARKSEILKADAEFQRLRAEYKAADKARNELASITYRYRLTVGQNNGLFFSVRAQGDSWEEIFTKLQNDKASGLAGLGG